MLFTNLLQSNKHTVLAMCFEQTYHEIKTLTLVLILYVLCDFYFTLKSEQVFIVHF